MRFVIGSTSARKIDVTKKTISSVLETTFEVVGHPSKSGVPDTPWDKETYSGAKNRALEAKHHIEGNYFVGLESGLIERYGSVYEEAWCCIIDNDDNEYFGYSSGLRVPQGIIDEIESSGMTHAEVMHRLEEEHGLQDSDTWGSYTGRKIIRAISLEEALRNTLVQIFAPKDSLYKLVAK